MILILSTNHFCVFYEGDYIMPLSDSQVIVAMIIALGNFIFAIRLGIELYK